MNPFNKLVQNKRSKMLILTILLTTAVLIKQSASINLTYIVKKDGEKLQPSCIAEENERYNGIGWVYPIGSEEPTITTKFLPTIKNNFNCKFSKSDKCNKIWALKNWINDENSTKTLDLLLDSRWEDLPTIYTGKDAKEFQEKIEIPSIFRAGFSVRAYGSVELLLCEGWKPYDYPCYHINISTNTIFLRKYSVLPKNISNSDNFLAPYTAVAKILSAEEWRNFVINLDDKGVLTLTDVSVNRNVIEYEDKEVLKPIYLLMRSEEQALWKIHQNQFIYTKTPQISRLGPILNLPSKEMCVALFVSTCKNCQMSFFLVKDNEKKFLVDVEPTENWRLIKLIDDHVSVDKLNIFVETKFKNNSDQIEGFWAVDDVRVCHENEVKVTFLKLQNAKNESSDEISCQVIQHPKWRPKKLEYRGIKDFPTINNSSDSTSIFLNWTQEDPNNKINYFISYDANDLCPIGAPNLKRLKSNGFLMTKFNEITLKNLIPYTKYNITFSSVLHENSKKITVTTEESDTPTMEEIPSKLNVQVTDTQAFVSWDKIHCTSIFGPVLYSIKATNFKTNETKEIAIQKDNTIQINDLEPYTKYTLHITTARNFENLQKNNNTIEITTTFTTQPGKAAAVQNLELYSVDKNSVSFRYDLPKSSKGIPVFTQITRCNALSFKKCKSNNFPISRCKLWPKKYCIDLNNLIPGQNYSFRVSVRNEGTQIYGDEVKVDAFLDERVPGAPINISYRIVDCKDDLDYCHLNISWVHPYYQNGTIDSFHLVLNSTANTERDIQEVLKIFNSSFYLPKYNYQIKFIPYSTQYDLYIQSVNSKYKSPYSHIQVKTDDIGNHIDQTPTLLQSYPNSVIFKLPILDHRLKSYTVTTIVQNFERNQPLPMEIKTNTKIANILCHNFGDTWILNKIEVNTNETKILEVGNGKENNRYLTANTSYCFTFIITNFYKNNEHDVVYYKKLVTPEDKVLEGNFNPLFFLLFLLLLIPIGFLIYRCYKKQRPRKRRQNENNKENVYESLPFEECEDNCANNDTYDHLLHK